MTGRGRRRAVAALQAALILAAMAVMTLPIAWIFMAAFKRHVDVYQLKLLFAPTLQNFALVFDSPYNLGDTGTHEVLMTYKPGERPDLSDAETGR